ncbi:MarR family winged helix-turn-helix transcriptional regulator [Sphingomonas sp. OK281]|uniref:MarR family winged helix-turn-helix transcriptional regulator n=1 Tax=Sphingomonas sp. OK281 TaxID=1881067 RepID=UPI0008EE6A5F|nr:MarR family winged helix-turn-helix transcriptional regulator [Sphingomonas sp. OK281]SFO06160.1 Winged helix DNA-binding domain-containing protein [Sphingomonas sp. OK281]
MTYAIALFPTGASKRPSFPSLADPALDGSLSSALIGVARRLYAMRKVRDEMLGEALFSEPAWNILLDLFISDHEGSRLSVSAVCIGARAPSATALRYLTMLQDADLVERTRDERDARRSHVRLTVLGKRRMSSLLGRMIE